MNNSNDLVIASENSQDVQKLNDYLDVKVLFGSLHGCEFHLPPGHYFFITDSNPQNLSQNSADAIKEQSLAHFKNNTLYLPCNTPTPNFGLHVTEPLQSSLDGKFSLKICIYDKNVSSEYDIYENQVFNQDNICLVIKRNDQDWDYEVPDCEVKNSTTTNESVFTSRSFFAIFAILLAMITSTTIFLWHHNTSAEQRSINIDTYFANSPSAISILKGRSNSDFYVLTNDYHEIEWLHEAISQYSGHETITPIFISQISKTTIDKLRSSGLPVLQLNLDIAQHPVIAVHRSLTKNEELSLKEVVFSQLPFALDTDIKTIEPVNLIDLAKHGLDKLHIFYQVISNTNGYALVIHEQLSDTQIYSLKKFVTEFHKNWGNEIVKFNIELDEDWLSDKSYVDASYSYVFLSPTHWYFPTNSSEEH